MKESITKFDLEAAFKALDAIDIPTAESGINANKPALTEIFSRKSKFDVLMEEYYDISSTEELSDAKEAQEAEVAKAKLARIEKIVDLDAESPEDLLTSYVGKFIIQCPQCMTLFYKNPEDIEESEEDNETVNVNEVCQHCGNESGYTLIGKVGEATAEETTETSEATDDFAAEDNETEITDDENTEEASEENIELDDLGDLEALDLEVEEEPEEANESLDLEQAESVLLTEDIELDTSIEDFEKLINSSEFKKPISDTEARTMINEFEETESETDKEEKLDESIEINGEELKYAVLNSDGTFVGAPCISLEEAQDLAAQKEDRIIVELNKLDIDTLNEGGLGALGKALVKRAKQIGKSVKDTFSAAIDKFTENVETREEKANWILKNACEDYKNAEVNNEGKLMPDDQSRKFEVFVVIGFKEKYSNGKLITMAPSFNNKDLVFGMNKPEVKDNYTDADNIAKGWSQAQGNGPAFIYMAKDEKDPKAVFLCEYFKGELKNDQLPKYYEVVKKDIEAALLMKKGNMDQSDDSAEETIKTKEITASEIKEGMEVVLDGDRAEVLEIGKSRFGNDALAIKVKFADNAIETMNVGSNAMIKIVDTEALESFEATPENLKALIEDLEDLQEVSLEEAISTSLIENVDNIAGFKLTDCEYLNEALTIKGRTYFTSGESEETSYSFTAAFKSKDTIKFAGLNENINFELVGKIEESNKVFITEAFKYNN